MKFAIIILHQKFYVQALIIFGSDQAENAGKY